MDSRKEYGNYGEKLAEEYLISLEYKILEKNHVNKIGEIDIIALDKNYIVFVEVKSRMNQNFGLPREAVTKSKQRKIRMCALAYLQQKKLMNANVRFDVIEVDKAQITHLKNCF